MEALVFVRFIFNVPILDHVLSSRRCKGVVVSGKKAAVERDEPLTIRDLQRLRSLLEDVSEPLWEAVMTPSTSGRLRLNGPPAVPADGRIISDDSRRLVVF